MNWVRVGIYLYVVDFYCVELIVDSRFLCIYLGVVFFIDIQIRNWSLYVLFALADILDVFHVMCQESNIREL